MESASLFDLLVWGFRFVAGASEVWSPCVSGVVSGLACHGPVLSNFAVLGALCLAYCGGLLGLSGETESPI